MNTKDVIINSARDLFSKYGYKKVSMDEIANTANVTKKTVYSYFKDKDSLFLYFIEEELETLKVNIEKERKKSKNVIDFVSTTAYNIIMYGKSNLLISNMFLESAEAESKTKKFLKLYENSILKYIENLIQEEITLKHIKKCDPHLAAFIIYKTYLNVLFDYEKNIDAKKASLEITSILKDGLLNEEN